MPPELLLLTGRVGWRRKEGQALPKFLPHEEFTPNSWSKHTRPQQLGCTVRGGHHLLRHTSPSRIPKGQPRPAAPLRSWATQPWHSNWNTKRKDWKRGGNLTSERLGGRRKGLDETICIFYICKMFLYKTATASTTLRRALWCSSSRYKWCTGD